MARLNAATRNALPASDFAGPGRSYPVEDKAHAIAAKSMASQYAPPAVKAKVDAKANKVLSGGAPAAPAAPSTPSPAMSYPPIMQKKAPKYNPDNDVPPTAKRKGRGFGM